MKIINGEPYFDNEKEASAFRIRLRSNRLTRLLFNAKIPIPLTIIETELKMITTSIEELKEAQRQADGISGEDAGYAIPVLPNDEKHYFIDQNNE